MSTLYAGIAELVTNDPAQGDGSALGIIEDGAVLVDDDTVEWVGRRSNAPAADERVDFGGSSVIPGFVDSHAHLVFAGERSAELRRPDERRTLCGGRNRDNRGVHARRRRRDVDRRG